jgi:hypothetical protein
LPNDSAAGAAAIAGAVPMPDKDTVGLTVASVANASVPSGRRGPGVAMVTKRC